MVGIFKKISETLSNRMMAPGAEESDGYYYDEYEDYDDDDYDDEPEIQVRYSKQDKPSRKSGAKSSSSRAARDNVYNISQNPSAVNVHKQSETVIMHPKNMEDAVELGSHVRSGRMCIVDLTGVATADAQRIADYLCGTSDALDGAITRVNNTIITVSPSNHRVMPDYREDNSSFDTGFLKAANGR
ncbi:MAG: cell division protein SepF [Defluviitaleaceae bacterium]|nr:cell division protein SepF [Defluviitaleaceae bacterium]MCL2262837.1 cell division protein SepF [Defluviitaleaceae bacterium]